jgi:glyoxylase I family protein
MSYDAPGPNGTTACRFVGRISPASPPRCARGVAIEGDVVQRRGAYGTGPSLYIRDPDGHLIELKPR